MRPNDSIGSLQPLANYKLLIFDCDGVILDSNAVKTEAFRKLAEPFGSAVTERFIKYHRDNGGISRYVKLRQLLDLGGVAQQDRRLAALLDAFAAAVRQGLMHCPVAADLERLRTVTADARWAIASGGDQEELRDVLSARGLSVLFDAGIHGSPTAKVEHVRRLVAEHAGTPSTALMLGDSRLDHEAAAACGTDFLFLSDWTDYDDWQAYVGRHGLPAYPKVSTLLAGTKDAGR